MTSLVEPLVEPSDVSVAPTSQVRPRTSVARLLLPVLGLACALVAGVVYLNGRGRETTDAAQVEAHVAPVSPRIAGQIKAVLVAENQVVRAGDVLVVLDERDLKDRLAAAIADRDAAGASVQLAEARFRVAEALARSNLRVAQGGVSQASALAGSARSEIAIATAAITVASSHRDQARLDLERTTSLHAAGTVPDSALEASRNLLTQAEASEAQARARLEAANESITNSQGSVEAARGRLLGAEAGPAQIEAAKAEVALAKARRAQADAAVAQAELNLSYTEVRAELPGVVTKRSAEPGQTVSPERPLMAIVQVSDPWVVANFKEDQIERMRPGMTATVRVDAYPGQDFHARVTSLTPGTGSRFALLPPDNSSGNFTKVVQRVPVLLRFEPVPPVALRPGMSSEVTVFDR